MQQQQETQADAATTAAAPSSKLTQHQYPALCCSIRHSQCSTRSDCNTNCNSRTATAAMLAKLLTSQRGGCCRCGDKGCSAVVALDVEHVSYPFSSVSCQYYLEVASLTAGAPARAQTSASSISAVALICSACRSEARACSFSLVILDRAVFVCTSHSTQHMCAALTQGTAAQLSCTQPKPDDKCSPVHCPEISHVSALGHGQRRSA